MTGSMIPDAVYGTRKASITLLPSDLLVLWSVPKMVVPAPGVGRMVFPVRVHSEWNANRGSYELTSPHLMYGTDPDSTPNNVAQVVATASTVDAVAMSFPDDLPFDRTDIENVGLWVAAGFDPGTPGGEPLYRAPILVSSLAAGGSAYAPGDTGTIDFDGQAAYQVDTVNAGVVVTYHLTDNGVGYDTISNPLTTTPTSGGGAGLTLNVDSIGEADGRIDVTVWYETITLH